MEKKLENILDKVFEMYNRYGIKSVTMDDVANMLGMSKKTLYQYVKDKKDLVEKVIDRAIEKTNCERNDIVKKDSNAIQQLFEVTYFMTQHIKNHNPSLEFDLRKYYPALYHKVSEKRKLGIYEGISKNLLKGKDEGLYRDEIDVDIITRVFVSRLVNSFENSMFTPDEIGSSRVFKEVMIYHLYGICNNKGVKLVEEILEQTHFMEELV